MRKFFKLFPQGTHIIIRSLVLILIAMVVFITIGTIFALARSHDTKPILHFGKSEEIQETTDINDDTGIFSGIGRLRIPLVNSSTLILSIAFPYSLHDSAFMEELAVRISDFRSIAIEYFSSLSADNIVNLDESAAKAEILKRYNNKLRLGKIETLYFIDLLII